MCVYLLYWQLPGAQITACHIRGFCLSRPALKDSFTPSDYHNQQQFGGLEATQRDLSTDQSPQMDRLGSPKSAFSHLVVKCIS